MPRPQVSSHPGVSEVHGANAQIPRAVRRGGLGWAAMSWGAGQGWHGVGWVGKHRPFIPSLGTRHKACFDVFMHCEISSIFEIRDWGPRVLEDRPAWRVAWQRD